MASGKLDLKGNMEQLDLKGEVIMDRTEFTIPGKLPPDVVVVSVTEINVPPGMKSEQPSQKAPLPLSLDLIVQIPSRFFVRGRGLDAEFKGKLAVKGPADNPVIRGNLDVVRGTFNFLDRKFTVTNGQISFSGATPPVPYLNITTQVSAGEIDARVSISGPADAFTLSLSSQPPLPQDEVMANILFGRSVANLNAFQAYQIASSISQIAGGGMPDLVGKTRSLLGIDRLDFSGGDEKTGPSVSMGKYVSEKVYVGVEQDLTDNKQDVVVEVDITPNFSVESKAGSKSGAGLGFNWKFDY
jgi:translocation and assembly module TamB